MRDYFFLKVNAKNARIFYTDLLYVEAVDKYVRFVTEKQTYLVLGCMCHVEKKLPPSQFCRINRSCIVSFRHITEFTCEKILIDGNEFTLGKQYRE
ncbi:MAG TPA: LytTR family DNA-binding domain-containing protein, partial [Chitinophagaceae bacterium]|nr:LytTR family DNA-binding domain-containing protein [Chitinophagaceae bacterium]